MTSSIQKKTPEKKQDLDDFSALISMPKNTSSISTVQSQKIYNMPEAKTPEELLQTDPTQREFERALFTSLDLIPDIPYDLIGYQPQNPVNVPTEYPQTPNMKLFQPEFLKNYDLSTLFYIFYYFPGSTQQYFAGEELKKRNWIYHNMNKTWYHRLSEPCEKTSDYEIGKFEYFDSVSKDYWGIKQIEAFKLEYRFVDEY
ncbi:CCR4-NOT transcription complex, subunit 3 [Tritrichomonas musculus]|uniref:CCR4-NOT transcription complex, subunit 3 n=1 Tax=Tritrichomonas musculus TaxID=1915356 RepID=A0ABR2ICR3_9EUKA